APALGPWKPTDYLLVCRGSSRKSRSPHTLDEPREATRLTQMAPLPRRPNGAAPTATTALTSGAVHGFEVEAHARRHEAHVQPQSHEADAGRARHEGGHGGHEPSGEGFEHHRNGGRNDRQVDEQG